MTPGSFSSLYRLCLLFTPRSRKVGAGRYWLDVAAPAAWEMAPGSQGMWRRRS